MPRELSFAQAVLEATDQCMAEDPSVYIMGLGVTDPKGLFGTTLGLKDKHGAKRVLDMPVAENGMTGIAIGSALAGMRPIMTHQRVDFMLLALDQIINNAAKWHYMFGGKMKVPLVIRLLIGRGWGQGPQHSQSLQAMFAHVPGLKVVMPTTPHDAKGLLIAAIRDDNPIIYIEHRWLHNIFGQVPKEVYEVPIGKAKLVRQGNDVTIVSLSYMTLEAMKAAEILERDGIDAEIIDLRSLKPLDEESIITSVEKTGRLIVVDSSWKSFGAPSEIITLVVEKIFKSLKSAPRRITLPDLPTPTSPALTRYYYPRAITIINTVRKTLGLDEKTEAALDIEQVLPLDVPDQTFRGPF
jgi:pyruvate/2-oxoglutarate/acetoin dehydrogenase E1 component